MYRLISLNNDFFSLSRYHTKKGICLVSVDYVTTSKNVKYNVKYNVLSFWPIKTKNALKCKIKTSWLSKYLKKKRK